MKSKTECHFLMFQLFVKIKHLPLLSTVNIPLVEFIHIVTAFYHLLTYLVLFIHLLIDASKYAPEISSAELEGAREREVSPCPFSKIRKKCPNLREKCADCCHVWVKFLI